MNPHISHSFVFSHLVSNAGRVKLCQGRAGTAAPSTVPAPAPRPQQRSLPALCRLERAGAPRAAAELRLLPCGPASQGSHGAAPALEEGVVLVPRHGTSHFPDSGHKSSSRERGMHPVLPKLLSMGKGLPVSAWPHRPLGPRHDAEGLAWSQPGYFCCREGMEREILWGSQPG